MKFAVRKKQEQLFSEVVELAVRKRQEQLFSEVVKFAVRKSKNSFLTVSVLHLPVSDLCGCRVQPVVLGG